MTNRCPQCGREGHADNDCPFEWMTNVDPGASAPAPTRCCERGNFGEPHDCAKEPAPISAKCAENNGAISASPVRVEDLIAYAKEISEPPHWESHRVIKQLLTAYDALKKEYDYVKLAYDAANIYQLNAEIEKLKARNTFLEERSRIDDEQKSVLTQLLEERGRELSEARAEAITERSIAHARTKERNEAKLEVERLKKMLEYERQREFPTQGHRELSLLLECDRYRAALERIAKDFGTDACDGNTMIAHEALEGEK